MYQLNIVSVTLKLANILKMLPIILEQLVNAEAEYFINNIITADRHIG
jgi:hypothetical protein